MRIFVYEFITGGGMLSLGEPVEESLLREGLAMVRALVDDALSCGMEVVAMRDARLSVDLPQECRSLTVESLEQERQAFSQCAASADWTILIAPEFDDLLAQRAERVVESGGRLFSPNVDLIRLTADKQATAEHLRRARVPVAEGCLVSPETLPASFPLPAVIKPVAAAGSLGIRRIESLAEGRQHMETQAGNCWNGVWRLEQYYSGTAASVAVLCGSAGVDPLQPFRQNLSEDGRFSYLGGETPLPDALAERARQLAKAAVMTLPAPLGYIGVDLVLGDAADGSQDVVIEINPRLTTSYVGLRHVYRDNLVQAMLAVAAGREPTLSRRPGRVEFASDGTILTGRTES